MLRDSSPAPSTLFGTYWAQQSCVEWINEMNEWMTQELCEERLISSSLQNHPTRYALDSTLPSTFEQIAPLCLSFLRRKVSFNPWSPILLRKSMHLSLWFHFQKINLSLWRTAESLSNPVIGLRKKVTISSTGVCILMALWRAGGGGCGEGRCGAPSVREAASGPGQFPEWGSSQWAIVNTLFPAQAGSLVYMNKSIRGQMLSLHNTCGNEY